MANFKRLTIIAYTLAFGIAIGYWAGQENAVNAAQVATAAAAK